MYDLDRQTDGRYLSLETSNCLKGIFAIIVVIHHLFQRTNIVCHSLFRVLLQASGYLSVAIFFFLSGYGLAASIQRRGRLYLSSFLITRILPLYVNTVIMIATYAFVLTVLIGERIHTRDFVISFLWGGTIIDYGWYVQSILVLYIAFYFTFRYVREVKFAFCLFNVLIACYCAVCVLLKLSSTWYEAVYAMPLGMFWLYRKDQIITRIKKHYAFPLMICCLTFAISFLGYKLCHNDYARIVLKMVSAISFVATVAVLVYKLPVNCRITRVLGKFSFEIYVVQGVVMKLLRSRLIYVTNNWLYYALCLIGIALMSVSLHPLFVAINRIFRKT